MKIIVSYRANRNAHGYETGACLARAFSRLGHDVWEYGKFYQEDVPITQMAPWPESEADLCVYCEMNDTDPVYIDLLKLKCPRIYWEFDSEMRPIFSASMTAIFDFNLMANIHFLEKTPRSVYMPYAVDETLFFPSEKNKHVVMIGSQFKERMEFAQSMGVQYLSGLYGDEYRRELAGARMTIHKYSSGGEGLIVMRPFEAMACKTLLLAEDQRAMRSIFTEKHYVSFFSREDCINKMHFFLHNDRERKIIVDNAYSEILHHHTFIVRARQILELVK